MKASFPPPRWLCLAILFIASIGMPAWAAERMVTNTADGGEGSLRYVIFHAQSGDTIFFDLDVPAVIAVNGGALSIDKDLTIIGTGVDDLWIDGMFRADPVFNVLAEGTLDIRQLGIRNSLMTGIRNSGTLLVSDVDFRFNRAPFSGKGGAILNIGTLVVSDSTFKDNEAGGGGGAIYSNAAATIERSTFVDNKSINGGAIFNDATMLVSASTFSGNEAIDKFGGSGGAIRNNAQMQLINSTLSDNYCNGAGGAIHNHTVGALTIAGSTIIDNEAPNSPGASALFRYGGVTVSRSIVAGACGGGALTSTGDNIGTSSTCMADSVALNDRNDASLTLHALAQNGGPTPTRLLPIGSPALDAVMLNTHHCTGTDQRGMPRMAGLGCDIGAVEMESMLIFADSFE